MLDSQPFSAENPLTISDLTHEIKDCLESAFPRLWVVGEISNFKAAASGHWYFSLKDPHSQIRANMWRSSANKVSFRPKDGMEVLVSGTLNVYAPRGEYSLVVDRIEEMGVGRLRQEFERLKKQLLAEGLFDEAHKQQLPLLPRKIGIVTSPTGAAIRDMLRVLKHRFEGVEVLIAPARVQGSGAAEEIAVGLQYLDRFGNCDVIIIGRGGGSEEDLWAFNEEIVARAIFAAETPIISAVGHEVDITISDFVADVRAATPSNAAELAVLTRDDYLNMIALAEQRIARRLQTKLLQWRQRVKVSETHPIFLKIRSRVNDAMRNLADLDYRQKRAMERQLATLKLRLLTSCERLHVERLKQKIQSYQQRLVFAEQGLRQAIEKKQKQAKNEVGGLMMRLADLSPLRVLARGFSVVYNQKGKVLRHPKDVKTGEILRVQMAEGELAVRAIEPMKSIEQPDLFD